MSEAKFLPYGRQSIEEDDIDAVVEVLRGDYLTTGPAIERFERALAAAVGAEAAVVVSSGTDALHAACFAAGVSAGDEVVVPAVSFLATANCARFLNAEPVFADVDPQTGLVVPSEVERHIGPKTRAIIPVHLNGVAADMPAIRKVAGQVGATVIEDAAHALGGLENGRAVGGCPDGGMAMFSFHPVKHITTGEGGAVTTNDPELARLLRLCRNHGMVRDDTALREPSPGPWYYEQQTLGHNMRLTDLQAALGVSQLAKLGRFVARRRELAGRYDDLLSRLPAVSPVVPRESRESCAYHLYAILIDFDALGATRAEVMRQLRERGIGTQVHFIPIPGQPYYRERGWRVEDFPGARRYYGRVLSLPLFPAMDNGDVDRVVTALAEVLEG